MNLGHLLFGNNPKNSSALQGRWLEEPEGFPTHVSFRKNKRVVTTPQGEQNGHNGCRRGNKTAITPLRMANKTAIMAAWV